MTMPLPSLRAKRSNPEIHIKDKRNMMNRTPAIYILASQKNGSLYIGVTSDLVKRIWQHKNKVIDGFSKKYDISMLVYCEIFDDMENAIMRAKKLKGGSRAKKLKLIESMNPNWNDLYNDIIG